MMSVLQIAGDYTKFAGQAELRNGFFVLM